MTERPSKTVQQASYSAESECFDLSNDLVEFEQQHRIAKLAAKVSELRQAKQERGDLHRIRKSHA